MPGLLTSMIFCLMISLTLLSSVAISSPIASNSRLTTETTSSTIRTSKTLKSRVKHNWALVCYDKQGLPNRSLYYHCTSSLTGYYCDVNGNVSWSLSVPGLIMLTLVQVHWRFYSSFDCWDGCQCTPVGASNIENCVWGIVAMSCWGTQKLAETSRADLQESVRNGTVLLPNGATIEDFIPSNNTASTSIALDYAPEIAKTSDVTSEILTASSMMATPSAITSSGASNLEKKGSTGWAVVC